MDVKCCSTNVVTNNVLLKDVIIMRLSFTNEARALEKSLSSLIERISISQWSR